MTTRSINGTPTGSPTIEITLVTSPGCHFCAHAHRALDAAAAEIAIEIREVALDSDEGRALQAKWRPPFPPMLLIDGDLFGYGRISQRKLMRHLARLSNDRLA